MHMRTCVLIAAATLWSGAATAADFSFAGTFSQDDDIAFFDFTASGASAVTLRSYSYAGGTNVAGATFAAGGFDPILTLYNLSTGARIAFQDDGGAAVPADPVTGLRYDVSFTSLLDAGNYRVALSQYDNFGGETLGDPFLRAGQGNFTSAYCAAGATPPFCDFSGAKRTGAWAFDVLGVSTATGPGGPGGPGGPVTPAIPEPATWMMMLAGFAMVSGAARYRRMSIKVGIA